MIKHLLATVTGILASTAFSQDASFFSTLYKNSPEKANKIAGAIAVCGFSMTQESALALLTSEEFSRLPMNAAALPEKCPTLASQLKLSATPSATATQIQPVAQAAPKPQPQPRAPLGGILGLLPTSAQVQVASAMGGQCSTEGMQQLPAEPGEVSDRRDVEGLAGWKGYVQGVPAGDRRMAKLKIGMSDKEVYATLCAPTDIVESTTGKAFIPYFRGSGTKEQWWHFKDLGRLLLASDGGQQTSRFYIIGIEHDSSESGYR